VEATATGQARRITVTDSAGRNVEIEVPVTRTVVVYSQLLLAMKAIGVEDAAIIGLDAFTLNQYRNVFTGTSRPATWT
jgi:ABC-type Fe3+-hydroxamate transport system substrate-binding protein